MIKFHNILQPVSDHGSHYFSAALLNYTGGSPVALIDNYVDPERITVHWLQIAGMDTPKIIHRLLEYFQVPIPPVPESELTPAYLGASSDYILKHFEPLNIELSQRRVEYLTKRRMSYASSRYYMDDVSRVYFHPYKPILHKVHAEATGKPPVELDLSEVEPTVPPSRITQRSVWATYEEVESQAFRDLVTAMQIQTVPRALSLPQDHRLMSNIRSSLGSARFKRQTSTARSRIRFAIEYPTMLPLIDKSKHGLYNQKTSQPRELKGPLIDRWLESNPSPIAHFKPIELIKDPSVDSLLVEFHRWYERYVAIWTAATSNQYHRLTLMADSDVFQWYTLEQLIEVTQEAGL